MAASYAEGGFLGKAPAAVKFFHRAEVASRVQDIVSERYEDGRKAREVATQEAGIDAAWIYKRLRYLTDISLQGKPIKRNGIETGENTKPDGHVAIKCLHLAAQMGGFLVQRLELGGPGDFARMSDEELDEALIIEGEALGIPKEAIQKALLLKGPDSSES